MMGEGGAGAGGAAPKVSIGMPVYNGERYIEGALESLLDQSFEDFEVIISDNASTDATERICKEYAARDRRITYSRLDTNRGPIYNFNRVFHLSRGRYFKWAAYDDLVGPDFLADCVAVLDGDPGVVLVCPYIIAIDENGERVPLNAKIGPGHETITTERRLDLVPGSPSSRSDDPVARFRSLMRELWWTTELYGLIRAEALANTGLYRNHWMGDHILLAELVLHGRFHEIPKEGFFTRMHTQKTSHVSTAKERQAVITVGRPQRKFGALLQGVWSYPDRFIAHAAGIRRAPLPLGTKVRCYIELVSAVARWGYLKIRNAVSARLGARSDAGSSSRHGSS